jgi:hypothetical protein
MSSDCSSIPDAKFFNEKYTYPPWFTRKKMIFHNKMLRRLKRLRFLHSRSSQHYEKMNIKLSAPSIVITALSGIASFLSTSQYVDADSQNACGITVGVLASIASVFQAFSAACQYGAKKEAHRTVAEQYNSLIVKTKFEMEMPNEEDFIDKLEQSILEIDSKCNYFVPQFIINEWEKQEINELDKKPKKITNDHDNAENLNIGLYMDGEEGKSPQPQQINNVIEKSLTNLENDHIAIKIIEEDSIDKEKNKTNVNTYLLEEKNSKNSLNVIIDTVGSSESENDLKESNNNSTV